MPYCPSCGNEVGDDDSFCNACGTAVDGSQGQSPAGAQGGQQAPPAGGGRQPPSQPQGQQGPHAGQGQQPPRQGQQRAPRSPPQGQQPPPAGPPDQGRRNLLKYGAGAAALGVAGVGGFLLMGGSGGPKGTSRSFVNSLNSGNLDQANSMVHSDSPSGEIPSMAASTFQTAEISIDSMEVESETETSATVNAQVRIEGEMVGGEGTSTSMTIELRKENGEWRVWTFN